MNQLFRRGATCVAMSLLLVQSYSFAATAPYFEGFDGYAAGDTTVANFTEAPTSLWLIESPSYSGNAYEAGASVFSSGTGVAVGQNLSAGIDFPALGSSSFSMSTTFRIDTLTLAGSDAANTVTFGLFARSAGIDPAFTNWDRYQVTYFLDSDASGHATGKLWLRENNLFFGDSLNEISVGTMPVSLGDIYQLTFAGVDSGGSLALTATITNLNTAASISVSDTDGSNLLAHTNFGYINLAYVEDGGTVAFNADFDNFSMVVPEPAAITLLATALATTCLLRLRRPR